MLGSRCVIADNFGGEMNNQLSAENFNDDHYSVAAGFGILNFLHHFANTHRAVAETAVECGREKSHVKVALIHCLLVD